MKVAVRIRPLNQREIDAKCSACVRSASENEVETTNADGENRRYRNIDWCFDQSKRQQSDTQYKVCCVIADDVTDAVACGYNASVIAFGQTGAGKTYTMFGSSAAEAWRTGYGIAGLAGSNNSQQAPAVFGSRKSPSAQFTETVGPDVDIGVTQAICQNLFSLTLCNKAVSQIELSMMEVYHDHVIDLLPLQQDPMGTSRLPQKRVPLKVKEHPKTGPFVQGLTRRRVNCYTELSELVKLGISRQSSGDITAVKLQNVGSKSQSHLVVCIHFVQAEFNDQTPSELTSKIYLVDLADRQPVYGSRASVEERRKAEGVNRSLTAFNNVINALSTSKADMANDGSSRYGLSRRRRRSVFVPYNETALTSLLKECLGGNSMTVFLAAVSPASCHCVETSNTLKMASSVRSIGNRPVVNIDPSVARIRELLTESASLRSALGDSTGNERHKSLLPLKQFVETREKLKRTDEWIKILTGKWIDRWLVAVKNEVDFYKIVKSWKESEKSRHISGADSALGSDIECEHDSKSFSDENEKCDIDRYDDREVSGRSSLMKTESFRGHNRRDEQSHYKTETKVVLGAERRLSGSFSHECKTADQHNLQGCLQRQEQPQQQQQLNATKIVSSSNDMASNHEERCLQGRRFEQDKAVARISRSRQRMQSVDRRRADSQPASATRNRLPDPATSVHQRKASRSFVADVLVPPPRRGSTTLNVELIRPRYEEKQWTRDSHEEKQGDRESDDVKQGVRDSHEEQQGDRESDDVKQGVRDSHEEQQGVRESDDVKQGVRDSHEEQQGVRESDDVKQGVRDSHEEQQGVRESDDVKQGVRDSHEEQQGVRESDDVKQGVRDSHEEQQGVRESDDVKQGVRDSHEEQQGVRESDDVKQGVRDSHEEQQGVRDSYVEKQGVRESDDVKQGVRDSHEEQQRTREVNARQDRSVLVESRGEWTPSSSVTVTAAVNQNVVCGRSASDTDAAVPDEAELNNSMPLMTHLFGHVVDRLDSVRLAVGDVIQRRYEHLTTLPRELNQEAINKLTSQIDGLQPIINYIEQMLLSEAACSDVVTKRKYQEKLCHYRRLLAALQTYIEVNSLLRTVDDNLRQPVKVYTELVDDLDRLDSITSAMQRELAIEKQSYYVLQIEVQIMRQRVLKEIDDAWNELISWRLPPLDYDKEDNNDHVTSNTATLNLSAVKQNMKAAEDIATASARVGRIDSEVSAFCDRLLARLIRNVTGSAAGCGNLPNVAVTSSSKYAGRVFVVNNATTQTVTIIPDTQKSVESTGNECSSSSPELVLDQLEQIFDFLDRSLSGIKISVVQRTTTVDSKSNLSSSSARVENTVVTDNTLMRKIGEVAIARILDCIYADCLSHIVEKASLDSSDEFTKLDRIAHLVGQFEDSLRRHLQLQLTGKHDLTKHEVAVIPHASLAARLREACERAGAATCGRLLTKTHSLIANGDCDAGVQGPQTIVITSGMVLGERPTINASQCKTSSGCQWPAIEEFVTRCRDETKTSNYRLPTCRVSVTMRELVCLIYDTLQQAISASSHGSRTLYKAICQVVELFCDLEPFYRRDQLANSPRYVAIHHNNCMYLAHHLITVDKMFVCRKSASTSDRSGSSGPTATCEPSGGNAGSGRLRELVVAVKRLGNDYFTRHVNWQKHQISQLLVTESGFACIADDDGRRVLKAVGDMLRYVKRVAAAWRDVLPLNAYCRSLGSLLNCALRDIISEVLAVGEYSVDDCHVIQKVLTTVIDDVINQSTGDSSVTLFPSPQQISNGDESIELDLSGDCLALSIGSPRPNRKSAVVTTSSSTASTTAEQLLPIDCRCPVEVTVERCVPSWRRYRELVGFFELNLAGVSERWASGKGPLAMYFNGSDIARLVEAIFERTSRRDEIVQILRRQPSVHGTSVGDTLP